MTRFAQILRETTWRTKPSGTLRPFNFESHSIAPNANVLLDEGASSVDVLDETPGAFSIGGTIDTWLYPEVVSSVLFGGINIAGNINTTGAGPFTHDVIAGEKISSYYLELGYDETGTREILGMVINETTIDAPKREKVTTSMTVLGAKEPNSGTTLAASQSISTSVPTAPFVYHEAELKLDTVSKTNVEAAQLRVNNNLPDDKYSLQDKYLDDITDDLGKREITWALDVRFESGADYNKFIGDTQFGLSLDMVKGTNRFLIETPKCIYTGFPANVSGRDRFLISSEVRVIFDTAAGHALKYTVTNSESGTVFAS